MDVWREAFPLNKQYTWMKVNSNMISGARSDRIYVHSYTAYNKRILESTLKQLEQDILYTDDKTDEVDTAECLERNSFFFNGIFWKKGPRDTYPCKVYFL